MGMLAKVKTFVIGLLEAAIVVGVTNDAEEEGFTHEVGHNIVEAEIVGQRRAGVTGQFAELERGELEEHTALRAGGNLRTEEVPRAARVQETRTFDLERTSSLRRAEAGLAPGDENGLRGLTTDVLYFDPAAADIVLALEVENRKVNLTAELAVRVDANLVV